jgi:ATP-dependent RNA helicase RhlE
MRFDELKLNEIIVRAIKEKGYTTPTPIQEQAIPAILEGRDLLGCAQTGTGKTAAFVVPTLHRLLADRQKGNFNNNIKCLIVTPTRELAIQIDENIAEYSKGSNLKHTVIFGGVKQHWQVRKIRSGVDILTATPGRLLDLMNQKIVQLGNLQIFTLDEADRMLDMGFIHDVKKIIAKLPRKRQSLFFSATMPDSIINLADSLLTNPVKVTVAPVASTAEMIDQKLYFIGKENKKQLLTHILKNSDVESALVFTRTKHGANKIAEHIQKSGISAAAIHGNKSQSARQKALKAFKSREIKVMVATDIASRGIDIDQLSHVINFEIPNEAETYVHRIGRTGRAKNSGIAISLCDAEEVGYIKDIHRLIKKEIPIEDGHPYPADHDLTKGARPPKKQGAGYTRKGRGGKSRGNFAKRRENRFRGRKG